MLILFCILVAAWLIVGYIGWRIMYYTMLKHWYELFGDDYREFNNGDNTARMWKRSMPVIIVGGVVSLICALNDGDYKKYGAVWYFKVPKHTPARDPMAAITSN